MLQKVHLRDHLRAAIAEREKRRQSVEKAAVALQRGEALLGEAEARLSQLSDVEDAIAAHHAEQVKVWAGSGGKEPGADIPGKLIARRKERDTTVDEIAAARAACKALSDDLDAANVELTGAEHNASEAAAAVLLEEADRVATYLEAAKREVWRLESQLHGLGEVWVPTATGLKPVRLSRQVQDALSAVEPQYPPQQRPEARQATAWRSFHTALLNNPEKTREEEPK